MELLLDPAGEDDLELLEILEVSHVVVGRIDAEVPARISVPAKD